MSKRFKKGTANRDIVDELVNLRKELELDDEGSYIIEKAAIEKRYTYGPLYSPGVIDAHGEYTDAEELQKALWDFNLGHDKDLRKQHGNQRIGKIVELHQWPFEHEAKLSLPGGITKSVNLPAGTVYAGVIWSKDAWPDVKAGRLTGYSMGGTGVRVRNAANDAELIKFT